MNNFAATIPILIVVLSGIAAMLAEAIRHPGERMYIAGFGLIGLVGAAVASVLPLGHRRGQLRRRPRRQLRALHQHHPLHRRHPDDGVFE